MQYTVYILYSKSVNRYYVGETEDLNARLLSHKAGISRYTSIAKDWICVHQEAFPDRTSAIRRERAIKAKKSRKFIEDLINKGG